MPRTKEEIARSNLLKALKPPPAAKSPRRQNGGKGAPKGLARSKASGKSKTSTTPSAAGQPVVRRHCKPGTVLRRYSKSEQLLRRKLPFAGLFREIIQADGHGLHFEDRAIEALQEAAEAYMIKVFGTMNLCARHAGRETVRLEDFHYVRKVFGIFAPYQAM